ncbi:MAG: polysaccharide biosynthesis protein [Betaproteobacteria bacterium]|nr:polysaccharide biosynthesis protein [Betaproteobacteria bacterium]
MIVTNKRMALALTHDIVMSGVAWALAFYLRFNFDVPPDSFKVLMQTVLGVIVVNSIIFIFFGLYKGIWRFASIPDLRRILISVGLITLIISLLELMLRFEVPRSVLILNPLLLVLMMGGSRFLYRAWKEHRLYGLTQILGEPVIVLGAGDTAVALLKSLIRSHEWRVIGFLDDNPELHGVHLYGVQVYGEISSLSLHASAMGVTHVIVAMPSASHETRHRAANIANQANLTVLTVPSFEDLMSGKVSVSQVRPIEVEDLLGREPVTLDDLGLHSLLDGMVVMVTGAGGSIGSELCRQIARYKPKLLVLFELNEYALYALEQEFSQLFLSTKIVSVVGDVKNAKRVDTVLKLYQPFVVFHAAAYKHVPLMENSNVSEALHNNIIGTHVLATSCKVHNVEKFILISTDKAVNPTNVMGASKRLAEMVCQGLQEADGTRFVIVRFGNVLGSSGSVIPKFREQIAKGGPLTVTHPEVTRYFMSIPEAAQLVMQASLMGQGGEIFVMDMGEPVNIAELAREMIRLSGLPDGQIDIVFTGLRPGEKLYEELLADNEHTLPTPHAKLRISKAREVDARWVGKLLKWLNSVTEQDESDIKSDLKFWVEDYTGDIHSTSPTVVLALPMAPSTTSIH